MYKAQELRDKTREELLILISELKGKLLALRFEAATGQLTETHLPSATKKDIALIFTVLKEKEQGIVIVSKAKVFNTEAPKKVESTPVVEEVKVETPEAPVAPVVEAVVETPVVEAAPVVEEAPVVETPIVEEAVAEVAEAIIEEEVIEEAAEAVTEVAEAIEEAIEEPTTSQDQEVTPTEGEAN